MGVVVRATDLTSSAPVALKILSTEGAGMAEIDARFEREVRAMGKVASDHVVQVLDAGRTLDGRPFLAMELLEGQDLATLLEQRGRLPREEAVGLVLQALAGVAAAHAAGVVHRDLKPANLFLARRAGAPPIVKVLDFGLTKILSSGVRLTLTAATLGTPMYMSPEQIGGTKNVDARCDQHALAMILFELLTGRPPYDFSNPGKLVVAIVTHPVPSPRAALPDLPLPLDQAIRKALAKQPDDRFADVVGFARAIAPYGPATGAASVRAAEASFAAAFGGDAEATSTLQMPRASPALSSFEAGPTEQIAVAPAARAAVLVPAHARGREPRARPGARAAKRARGRGVDIALLALGILLGAAAVLGVVLLASRLLALR